MITKRSQNWLLLRGLARESGHWGEFIDVMRAVFPEAGIHTLDLPGTGRFFHQQSPRAISDITDSVREQARQQGLLTQPLHILALSMGGMVAWEWGQRYPEDLASAVLVNTSLANLSPFYQRLRWQSYLKFAKILTESNLYQRELAIIRLVCNRRDDDESRAIAWAAIQQKQAVSLGNCFRQILAAACYKPIGKPKKPVLLLNSRGDRLVAPACSFAIHNHWRTNILTHDWAGHDLCLDDSLWLTSQLKTWLESQ